MDELVFISLCMVHIHVCAYACSYTCIYVYMWCLHMHVYMSVSTYGYLNMCLYVSLHIYVYLHRYIHIYLHIYINKFNGLLHHDHGYWWSWIVILLEIWYKCKLSGYILSRPTESETVGIHPIICLLTSFPVDHCIPILRTTDLKNSICSLLSI